MGLEKLKTVYGVDGTMSRLDIPRQKKLEPRRIQRALDELKELNIDTKVADDHKSVEFIHCGENVTYWPYSGWHSGKSIEDGRGFDHLFNQLKSKYK